jgi:hypothetical protein
MIEDRKLQAVAVPSTTTQGFTIYVLRDPHPPQNVPVAFETLPMDEWSPNVVETFMAENWGWGLAPGATWQELSGGRYGIRPIIAKEILR